MRLSADALAPVERYTWRLHWPAQVCAGLWEGILGLTAFAAMRSLGAPAWIAPLMVVLAQTPWVLSPMWEHTVAHLDPHRAFRWFGVGFALPLCCIAFVGVEPTGAGEGHGLGDIELFVGCYVLAYVVHGGYIAQRGALVRANYTKAVRGTVFGLLSVMARAGAIVSAKAAGWLLNSDPRWLRLVFPIGGLLALAEQLQLSRIRWRRGGRTGAAREPGAGLRETWRRSARLLRDDRGFGVYEVAWTLYGIGFLMSTPMIVVFGERDLGVSYDEWTWAQGVALPVASIAAMAPVGLLVDRIGAVRVTALSFALLAPFFALVPLIGSAGGLIAAFALWGVSMAGVGIAWNLGPLHFAPDGRGRQYAAAHVALVGLRSAIAPPLGYLLAAATSLDTVFLTSAVLVAAGATVAWWVDRAERSGRIAAAAGP